MLFRGPVPSVTITSELVEEKGGVTKGVLEAGEHATINLTITNEGDGLGDELELEIANLAGRQVKLGSRVLEIGDLDSGNSKVIALEVVAASTILTDEFGIGLSVKGDNMIRTYRTRIGIPCKKNGTSDKAAALLGH